MRILNGGFDCFCVCCLVVWGLRRFRIVYVYNGSFVLDREYREIMGLCIFVFGIVVDWINY